MNDRKFTERAQAAIQYAHQQAAELGHSYVGSEHLLLGLLQEQRGAAAKALQSHGVTREEVCAMVVRAVGRGAPGAPVQGLTPRAKRVVEIAFSESARLGHSCVGTEHLLMGLLRESEGLGCRVLASLGTDTRKLHADVMGVFGGEGERIGRRKKEASRGTPLTLDKFSRDLTQYAADGQLDPVVGREKELRRVMQILSRRSKNNPVLIGEPGVGKTAIAEALARRILAGDVPEPLRDKRLLSLDMAGAVAGTKYRGEFEERIRTVVDEVKRAGDIILFIDELHMLVGAGAAEGAIDASNILKPALGRGEIRVIGATTIEEYRRHIEKDAALERRFQPVLVEEPTEQESVEILRGLRERYEAHHGLKIRDEALHGAVELSRRYINDRFLPDKAVDLIDEAASRVRMQRMAAPGALKVLETELAALAREKESAIREQRFEQAGQLRDRETALQERLEQERSRWMDGTDGRGEVTAADVAAVVSDWTGIPAESITRDEGERLMRLEETLHRRVVGQEEAVRAVAMAVRRSRVGLRDPRRPIGSFLLLGPTGVGKTELCRALAEALFGDENAMIRVDMSEYMEKHTTSRLIGAPPGYVGYDDGGQLTERVRRKPYSVVLLDEVEKAHVDVLNLLLQVMEDGILTDSRGRRVDFRSCVLVMTSNVGAKRILGDGRKLGFAGQETAAGRYEQIRGEVLADLRRTFRPEFLNRVDETIVFARLEEPQLMGIARGMLEQVKARMKALGITLQVELSAVELLCRKGSDPAYGARPLRRTIQTMLENPAAEMLLDGRLQRGAEVTVTAGDGVLCFRQKEAAETG